MEAPPGPDAIFEGLCSASGIHSDAVTIKRISRDKGTGLFAARDIAKGDTVLRCVEAAVTINSCGGSTTSSSAPSTSNSSSSLWEPQLWQQLLPAASLSDWGGHTQATPHSVQRVVPPG